MYVYFNFFETGECLLKSQEPSLSEIFWDSAQVKIIAIKSTEAKDLV